MKKASISGSIPALISKLKSGLKSKFEASAETLMPFGIALAILCFAIIPHTSYADITTYYVNLPNLGSYGTGYGNGNGNGSNNGYGGYNGCAANTCGSNSNAAINRTPTCSTCSSPYPNYAYQYYKNPNQSAQSNSGNGYGNGNGNGGSNPYTPYVPMKAAYTPYPFPTYMQYKNTAPGIYELQAPRPIPAYPWNADNSLPSNVTGNTGYYGNPYGTSRGFVMTSQF
jgi:hypothetical protein